MKSSMCRVVLLSSFRCRAALLAGAASQGPSQGGHRGGCLTDRGGLADSVICRVVEHVADSLADNPAGVIGVVQDEPRAEVEVQESFLIPWCRSICVRAAEERGLTEEGMLVCGCALGQVFWCESMCPRAAEALGPRLQGAPPCPC